MTSRFVRPDASHGGANNGTSYADAWQGWTAINWATFADGDTLYLSGTFPLATANWLNTQTAGRAVTIRGDYPGVPRGSIVCTGAYSLVPSRTKTTWMNFDISATTAAAIAVNAAATFNTFSGINFTGIFANATEGNSGLLLLNTNTSGTQHSDIEISDCTFTGVFRSGIQWHPSGAGYVSGLTRLTIARNTFTDFTANMNGGGVSIRQEAVVDYGNALSGVVDLRVLDNTFTNFTGLPLRLTGAGAISITGWYNIDGYHGVKVLRNTIRNQFYDTLPVAGRPAGGWQTGGGLSITSFGNSLTPGFGRNEIAFNDFSGLQGFTGGVNTFTGTYWIHDNRFSNIETRIDTVDGNGILQGEGSHDVLIERNYVSDCPGGNKDNSGIGICLQSGINITARYNVVKRCKAGVFLIDQPYDIGATANVYNNTLLEIAYWGIYATGSSRLSRVTCFNNVVTGTGVNPTTAPGGQDGGYSMQVTDSEAFALETCNVFYNFGRMDGANPKGTWGATAGAIYPVNANTLAIDPQLDAANAPVLGSPLIAAGVFADYLVDAGGSTGTWNPPSIGAYEYVRPRPSRL